MPEGQCGRHFAGGQLLVEAMDGTLSFALGLGDDLCSRAACTALTDVPGKVAGTACAVASAACVVLSGRAMQLASAIAMSFMRLPGWRT